MAPRFPFRTRDGRRGLVRVAKPRDAKACLRIVTEAARERPRTLSILEDELWTPRMWRQHRCGWKAEGVSLVAQVEGEVVGQLTADRGRRRTSRHAAEFGITVAAAARNQGVGRALLDALEVWAREHGIERIGLGVFGDNERARSLYRAMGYADEGMERGGVRFPEGDKDILRMSKLLGAPQVGRTTMDASSERKGEGDG